MQDYKHELTKELTKMFITYKALTFINKQDIPPDATFFRFFLFLKLKFLCVRAHVCKTLCHGNQITSGRCRDGVRCYWRSSPFFLTVNAIITAAIHGDLLPSLEFW